jgi:hypothetical protein
VLCIKGEISLYDVNKMKSNIEAAVSIAELEVKNEFISVFNEIYVENKVPLTLDDLFQVSIIKLEKLEHIESIISGAGFYIILTDFNLADNPCELTKEESIKAIYRGECSTVKKRIKSHLFNSEYKKSYEERKRKYLAQEKNNGKEFYEQFWPACLKLGNGTNGIDIDGTEYNGNNWYVVVHNMKNSSQAVRVQAELAFDNCFNKPVASRENT